MAHKYKKINKEAVLSLFSRQKVVNRADITKEYKCSVYSARRELEDLLDEEIIKLTNYGYKLNN